MSKLYKTPCNTNNIHLDNEKHTNEETDYEKINARKIPNNVENDYVIPNKKLFGRAFNDEVLNNNIFKDEIPDDKAFDSEAFDETLEDFFYDKMLSDDEMIINFADNVLSEESDRIINLVLNIEEMLSISGEFSPYFKNPTEKLRDIAYSYKHPSEFAALEIPEGRFISKSEIYLLMKKTTKESFCAWPFVTEIKQLEKEIVMNVLGNRSLIIASLGAVTADLPQRNDLIGVKKHGAIRRCCTCNIVKNS
ncbi:23462_t:CDS:2 [Racocetra persica]|uniref:23462_t:CDS:1 n=1 Tax=Racocetra persica TaxID=160502 RepID=A0ACA9MPW0_9GLOM|nr:23462_t:CDS:2 [Racocetra persica]